MKTRMLADFQICISVPLKKSVMEPVQTIDKFDSGESFFNTRERERNFTRIQGNIFNQRDTRLFYFKKNAFKKQKTQNAKKIRNM